MHLLTLSHRVVPAHFQHTAIPCLDEALSHWSKGNSLSPSWGHCSTSPEKIGDTPRGSHTADRLLEEAPDDRSRSRLLGLFSERVRGLAKFFAYLISRPSVWTMTQFGWLRVFVLVLHCVNLTHVNTVALKSTN